MAFKMKGSPMQRNFPGAFKQTEGSQGKTTKPVEGKVNWDDAPALNTPEREAWYAKNNLKQDHTTTHKGADSHDIKGWYGREKEPGPRYDDYGDEHKKRQGAIIQGVMEKYNK